MNYLIFSFGYLKEFPISIFTLLLILSSCTKEETVISEKVSSDIEKSEEPPNDDSTENDNSTKDETFPPTGKIVFSQDFILDDTRSVVNYIIPSNEYNKFLEGNGSVEMISQKVYEYLKDDFDYIIILSVETVQPPDLFYGRATPVQNDIQGLGIDTYNNSASYGSDGNLNGIVYMPRTEYISNGPFLHEIAHTWANKGLIPTTISGHWGFASTGGQLGGFDELEDLGNNSYRGKLNGQNGFGTFANGGNSIVYSDLELYTMGLIGADELAPIQVAVNPAYGQNPGEFTADAIETYTAQDIINEHGQRIPSVANSQKNFKALTVVISTEEITQDKVDDVSLLLENFSRQANPDPNWGNIKNFWLATKEKATIDFIVPQESIK